MTAILTPTADLTTSVAESTTKRAVRPVWKAGLAAGLVAAAVVSAIAAVADAAGVSFLDGDGNRVPIAAFAEFTVISSLVGVAIAAVVARKARTPRSTFVRTTVALTALSVVPDFLVGFEASTVAVFVASHLVAAAIVIPAVASRLAPTS